MPKNDNVNFEKVLRIGISKDHAILKEHLLLPKKKFSIGTESDVQIRVDGILNHTLFQTKEGSYFLNFTPKMSGKLMESKSNVSSLDSLRTNKDVRCKGDVYSVRLSDTSKGKISVGGYTFIFQFVPAPPIAHQAKYQQNAKFLEDDDLLFLSLTLFNTLCASILLIYANFYFVIPEPPELTAEQIAQILDIQVEPEKKEDEPIEEEAIVDENATADAEKENLEEKSEDNTNSTEDVVVSDATNDGSEAMTDEQIDAALGELDDLNVAAILGSEGAGAPVLASMSTFSEDSAEISIAKTDTVSGGGLKIASVGDKALNTDSNIKIKKASGGSGKIKTGGPKVKVRKTKVKSGKVKASSNKCDAEIKKVLKKKQGNINFCYDRAVKDDDSLAGNIKLRITIKSSKNKVSFAKDDLKSKSFSDCIKRKVKKWKFDSKCNGITFQKTYILKTTN